MCIKRYGGGIAQRRPSEVAKKSRRSSVVSKQRDQVGEAVEIEVGGVGGAIVRAEAVVHRGGERSGVARGLHVHFGVADQNRFTGSGYQFAKDGVGAQGIGL